MSLVRKIQEKVSTYELESKYERARILLRRLNMFIEHQNGDNCELVLRSLIFDCLHPIEFHTDKPKIDVENKIKEYESISDYFITFSIRVLYRGVTKYDVLEFIYLGKHLGFNTTAILKEILNSI